MLAFALLYLKNSDMPPDIERTKAIPATGKCLVGGFTQNGSLRDSPCPPWLICHSNQSC